MKKYTAKTQVALNVVRNGKSMHISFTPITGGGSVYYTNDESIAKALESHYKFGKLYKLEKPAPVAAPKVEKAAPKAEPAKEEKKERVMSFSCYEDAKDYLVDTFGISRTKLRTQTAIANAFVAKGIKMTIKD